MSNEINQIIFKLFLGGLIGAIIGLEREKSMQNNHEHNPFGIRTNILIGLIGSLSIYLSNLLHPWVFPISFIAIIFLGFLPIIHNKSNEKFLSYKTSISSIIVFLLGALAFSGQFQIALAMCILVTFVLSLKYTLHQIIYGISYPEIIDGAKFIIIAFVILPFLPNQTFDQQVLSFFDPRAVLQQATNIINPYNIWFLIVIVSGLNFLGYILIKLIGKNRAYGLTGLIGGFYSSTVTSLNLALTSKNHPEIKYPFIAGILFACSSSFFKMFVLIHTLNTELFNHLFPGMIAMCFYLLINGIIFQFLASRRTVASKKKLTSKTISIESPLKLKSAVKLALFVILTMIGANLIFQYANINFYYLLAGLMAFLSADDPIIISTAGIAGQGISFDHAKNIILGVIFLNFLQKIATVYFFGNKKLLMPLAISFFGLFLVTISAFLYL